VWGGLFFVFRLCFGVCLVVAVRFCFTSAHVVMFGLGGCGCDCMLDWWFVFQGKWGWCYDKERFAWA
jgi:hypothetical protein